LHRYTPVDPAPFVMPDNNKYLATFRYDAVASLAMWWRPCTV
jgi:hypothetical protein